MSGNGKIYGIDLGTTNSCLSVLQDGKPRVIPIDDNGLTPSVVSLDGDTLIVGRKALNRAVAFPDDSVKSIKRLMGKNETVSLGGKEFTPEEISAKILGYLRDEAYRLEGHKVERAVITVPAYFSDAQRRATIEAGKQAGLTVERIINEPTAAALFYDQLRVETEGRTIGGGSWKHALVYDLGGGTFDVSILRLGDIIEVLASTGDTRLGGDDFDACLVNLLLEKIRENDGPDLRGYRPAMARLNAAAEQTKIALSTKAQSLIEEAYIPTPDGSPCTVSLEISREEFEELTGYLLDRTTDFVRKALDEARLRPDDIDRIIPVGGMTRMPAVAERLEEIFADAQIAVADPDLSVSLGAAIDGGIINGENVEQILLDVTAHTLSLAALSSYTGQEECVPIIPRNAVIPAARSRRFATVVGNQESVRLKVYQGEELYPEDNVLIGVADLALAKADAHCPIEVEYSYDLNGMVHMVAEQKGYSRRTEVEFDSRNPQLELTQELDLFDLDGDDASAEGKNNAEKDNERTGAQTAVGINFVIKRARTLLEKIEGENREQLADLLGRYEKALVEDSSELDALEDGLLTLMDKV
ncbi:MAG: Hsp70 family protein [Desulfovibrio sp.]|nr:Hsp70 family protein [Desulfovibrio sp.]